MAPIGNDHWLDMAVAFIAMAFLVWPAFVTILLLENVWSWDDAFPRGGRSGVRQPERDGGGAARPQVIEK